MKKITTGDAGALQKIDEAIAKLTEKQRQAIAELDASLPADHVILTDARDVAGVLAGMKQVAYVNKGLIAPALLKRMGLHRVVTSKVAEVYSLNPAAADEFKAAVENTFSNLSVAMPGHKVQGKLLGYPKTSTTYFMKRWADINKYPNVVLKSAVLTMSGEFFQDFILSPKHYAKEIRDYSEPLEYATAVLLPRTYKKMRRILRRYRFQRAIKRLVGRTPARPPIPELFVD